MSFIQQVVTTQIGKEGEYGSVVTVDQKSLTFLCKKGSVYSCVKQMFVKENDQNKTAKSNKSVGTWVELGRWNCPDEYPEIFLTVALEFCDIFMICASNKANTIIAFFDFQMNCINVCEVDQLLNITCGDFDQSRLEVLVGTAAGELGAFVVRRAAITNTSQPQNPRNPLLNFIRKGTIVTPNTVNSTENMNDFTFSVILRKSMRFPHKFIGIPMQIVSQDFPSMMLVLSNNGNVICVSTGLFSVVWYIGKKCFISKPIGIYGSKYGTYFVAKCRLKQLKRSTDIPEHASPSSATSRGSGVDSTGRKAKSVFDYCDCLEMWIPPHTSEGIHNSVFQRISIPLEGSGFSIQSSGYNPNKSNNAGDSRSPTFVSSPASMNAPFASFKSKILRSGVMCLEDLDMFAWLKSRRSTNNVVLSLKIEHINNMEAQRSDKQSMLAEGGSHNPLQCIGDSVCLITIVTDSRHVFVWKLLTDARSGLVSGLQLAGDLVLSDRIGCFQSDRSREICFMNNVQARATTDGFDLNMLNIDVPSVVSEDSDSVVNKGTTPREIPLDVVISPRDGTTKRSKRKSTVVSSSEDKRSFIPQYHNGFGVNLILGFSVPKAEVKFKGESYSVMLNAVSIMITHHSELLVFDLHFPNACDLYCRVVLQMVSNQINSRNQLEYVEYSMQNDALSMFPNEDQVQRLQLATNNIGNISSNVLSGDDVKDVIAPSDEVVPSKANSPERVVSQNTKIRNIVLDAINSSFRSQSVEPEDVTNFVIKNSRGSNISPNDKQVYHFDDSLPGSADDDNVERKMLSRKVMTARSSVSRVPSPVIEEKSEVETVLPVSKKTAIRVPTLEEYALSVTSDKEEGSGSVKVLDHEDDVAKPPIPIAKPHSRSSDRQGLSPFDSRVNSARNSVNLGVAAIEDPRPAVLFAEFSDDDDSLDNVVNVMSPLGLKSPLVDLESVAYIAKLQDKILMSNDALMFGNEPEDRVGDTVMFCPLVLFRELWYTNRFNQRDYGQFATPGGCLHFFNNPAALSIAPAVVNQSFGSYFPDLNLCTRAGLLVYVDSSYSTMKAISPKNCVDVKFYGIAFRSGRIVILNSVHEGFIYNYMSSYLNNSCPTSNEEKLTPPERLELAIRQQAVVTTLTTCDVCLRLNGYEKIQGGFKVNPRKTSYILGSNLLTLIADSDGVVNYVLTLCESDGTSLSASGNVTICTGSFVAHSEGIVSVLVTGDAVRPMWCVGTTSTDDATQKLSPIPIPGSAIVTVCQNGEVKVWQPKFTLPETNSLCKPDQLLCICSLEWELVGLFSAKSDGKSMAFPNTSIVDRDSPFAGSPTSSFAVAAGKIDDKAVVTSACLDPSCLSILLGFSDGFISSWVIPGIIVSSSTGSKGEMKAGKLYGPMQSTKECFWNSQLHRCAVNSMKVWSQYTNSTHFSNCSGSTEMCSMETCIATMSKSQLHDRLNAEDSSKLAIKYPGNFDYTVVYTTDEFMSICQFSNLVTSSHDHSLILWGYEISDATLMTASSTNLKSGGISVNANSVTIAVLIPVAIRRINCSAVPYNGICLSLVNLWNRTTNKNSLDNEKSVWLVFAVVKGIVVNVLSGSKSEVFCYGKYTERISKKLCTKGGLNGYRLALAMTQSDSEDSCSGLKRPSRPEKKQQLLCNSKYNYARYITGRNHEAFSYSLLQSKFLSNCVRKCAQNMHFKTDFRLEFGPNTLCKYAEDPSVTLGPFPINCRIYKPVFMLDTATRSIPSGMYSWDLFRSWVTQASHNNNKFDPQLVQLSAAAEMELSTAIMYDETDSSPRRLMTPAFEETFAGSPAGDAGEIVPVPKECVMSSTSNLNSFVSTLEKTVAPSIRVKNMEMSNPTPKYDYFNEQYFPVEEYDENSCRTGANGQLKVVYKGVHMALPLNVEHTTEEESQLYAEAILNASSRMLIRADRVSSPITNRILGYEPDDLLSAKSQQSHLASLVSSAGSLVQSLDGNSASLGQPVVSATADISVHKLPVASPENKDGDTVSILSYDNMFFSLSPDSSYASTFPVISPAASETGKLSVPIKPSLMANEEVERSSSESSSSEEEDDDEISHLKSHLSAPEENKEGENDSSVGSESGNRSLLSSFVSFDSNSESATSAKIKLALQNVISPQAMYNRQLQNHNNEIKEVLQQVDDYSIGSTGSDLESTSYSSSRMSATKSSIVSRYSLSQRTIAAAIQEAVEISDSPVSKPVDAGVAGKSITSTETRSAGNSLSIALTDSSAMTVAPDSILADDNRFVPQVIHRADTEVTRISIVSPVANDFRSEAVSPDLSYMDDSVLSAGGRQSQSLYRTSDLNLGSGKNSGDSYDYDLPYEDEKIDDDVDSVDNEAHPTKSYLLRKKVANKSKAHRGIWENCQQNAITGNWNTVNYTVKPVVYVSKSTSLTRFKEVGQKPGMRQYYHPVSVSTQPSCIYIERKKLAEERFILEKDMHLRQEHIPVLSDNHILNDTSHASSVVAVPTVSVVEETDIKVGKRLRGFSNDLVDLSVADSGETKVGSGVKPIPPKSIVKNVKSVEKLITDDFAHPDAKHDPVSVSFLTVIPAPSSAYADKGDREYFKKLNKQARSGQKFSSAVPLRRYVKVKEGIQSTSSEPKLDFDALLRDFKRSRSPDKHIEEYGLLSKYSTSHVRPISEGEMRGHSSGNNVFSGEKLAADNHTAMDDFGIRDSPTDELSRVSWDKEIDDEHVTHTAEKKRRVEDDLEASSEVLSLVRSSLPQPGLDYEHRDVHVAVSRSGHRDEVLPTPDDNKSISTASTEPDYSNVALSPQEVIEILLKDAGAKEKEAYENLNEVSRELLLESISKNIEELQQVAAAASANRKASVAIQNRRRKANVVFSDMIANLINTQVDVASLSLEMVSTGPTNVRVNVKSNEKAGIVIAFCVNSLQRMPPINLLLGDERLKSSEVHVVLKTMYDLPRTAFATVAGGRMTSVSLSDDCVLKVFDKTLPPTIQGHRHSMHKKAPICSFTFEQLRCSTDYDFYAIILYDESVCDHSFRMSTEGFLSTRLTAKTQPEAVELEWGRLTFDMQETEILCCFYDCFVRKMAETDNILFPELGKKDEDTQIVVTAADYVPNISLEERRKDDRVYQSFVTWWTGGNAMSGQSLVRNEFLLREALSGLLDKLVEEEVYEDIDDPEAHKKNEEELLKELSEGNQPSNHHGGHSHVPRVSLKSHSIERYTKMSALRICLEDNYITNDEFDELHSLGLKYAYCLELPIPLLKSEVNELNQIVAFRKYRSWYKGGSIVEDRQLELEKLEEENAMYSATESESESEEEENEEEEEAEDEDFHGELSSRKSIKDNEENSDDEEEEVSVGSKKSIHSAAVSLNSKSKSLASKNTKESKKTDAGSVTVTASVRVTLMEERLHVRTRTLEWRLDVLKRCWRMFLFLVGMYKRCLRKQLDVHGIINRPEEFRLMSIRKEDIRCIMGALKLVEIVEKQHYEADPFEFGTAVEPFDDGKYSADEYENKYSEFVERCRREDLDKLQQGYIRNFITPDISRLMRHKYYDTSRDPEAAGDEELDDIEREEAIRVRHHHHKDKDPSSGHHVKVHKNVLKSFRLRQRQIYRLQPLVFWIVLDKRDEHFINARLLESVHPLDMANLTLFVSRAPAEFMPNKPPVTNPVFLEGSDFRRPIKPWNTCCQKEQLLELRLACMLDEIVDLAVNSETCFMIPDQEDFLLDSAGCFVRSYAQRMFMDWYLGKEAINDNSVPTLARTMFSEIWERKAILEDPFVRSYMEKNLSYVENAGNSLPFKSNTSASTNSAQIPVVNTSKPEDMRSSRDNNDNEEEVEAEESEPVDEQALHVKKAEDDALKSSLYQQHILYAYERYQSSSKGVDLRCKLFERYLEVIVRCRNFSMSKNLWPTVSQKLSSQYMLPRLGVITPTYEIPQQRYQLFKSHYFLVDKTTGKVATIEGPNTRKEILAYTEDEMLSWYSNEELMEDDELMKTWEIKGQKQRAYLDWLAREEERVNEGRELMVIEDNRSLVAKLYWEHLEDKISMVAAGEANRAGQLLFQNPLPTKYYFLSDTVQYEYGSGMHNEDEMRDLLEEMEQRKEAERQAAIERKRKIEEEKRLIEEEKRLKAERAERDARLAEGVEIRRKLRIHLEELKTKRHLEEQLRQQAELDAQVERTKTAEIQENQRRLAMAAAQEVDRQIAETNMMQAEEILLREVYAAQADFYLMSEEDDLAHAVEAAWKTGEEMKLAEADLLKELLVPYIPFHFDNPLIPELHKKSNKEIVDEILDTGDSDSELVALLKSNYAAVAGNIVSPTRKKAVSFSQLSTPTGSKASGLSVTSGDSSKIEQNFSLKGDFMTHSESIGSIRIPKNQLSKKLKSVKSKEKLASKVLVAGNSESDFPLLFKPSYAHSGSPVARLTSKGVVGELNSTKFLEKQSGKFESLPVEPPVGLAGRLLNYSDIDRLQLDPESKQRLNTSADEIPVILNSHLGKDKFDPKYSGRGLMSYDVATAGLPTQRHMRMFSSNAPGEYDLLNDINPLIPVTVSSASQALVAASAAMTSDRLRNSVETNIFNGISAVNVGNSSPDIRTLKAIGLNRVQAKTLIEESERHQTMIFSAALRGDSFANTLQRAATRDKTVDDSVGNYVGLEGLTNQNKLRLNPVQSLYRLGNMSSLDAHLNISGKARGVMNDDPNAQYNPAILENFVESGNAEYNDNLDEEDGDRVSPLAFVEGNSRSNSPIIPIVFENDGGFKTLNFLASSVLEPLSLELKGRETPMSITDSLNSNGDTGFKANTKESLQNRLQLAKALKPLKSQLWFKNTVKPEEESLIDLSVDLTEIRDKECELAAVGVGVTPLTSDSGLNSRSASTVRSLTAFRKSSAPFSDSVPSSSELSARPMFKLKKSPREIASSDSMKPKSCEASIKPLASVTLDIDPVVATRSTITRNPKRLISPLKNPAISKLSQEEAANRIARSIAKHVYTVNKSRKDFVSGTADIAAMLGKMQRENLRGYVDSKQAIVNDRYVVDAYNVIPRMDTILDSNKIVQEFREDLVQSTDHLFSNRVKRENVEHKEMNAVLLSLYNPQRSLAHMSQMEESVLTSMVEKSESVPLSPHRAPSSEDVKMPTYVDSLASTSFSKKPLPRESIELKATLSKGSLTLSKLAGSDEGLKCEDDVPKDFNTSVQHDIAMSCMRSNISRSNSLQKILGDKLPKQLKNIDSSYLSSSVSAVEFNDSILSSQPGKKIANVAVENEGVGDRIVEVHPFEKSMGNLYKLESDSNRSGNNVLGPTVLGLNISTLGSIATGRVEKKLSSKLSSEKSEGSKHANVNKSTSSMPFAPTKPFGIKGGTFQALNKSSSAVNILPELKLPPLASSKSNTQLPPVTRPGPVKRSTVKNEGKLNTISLSSLKKLPSGVISDDLSVSDHGSARSVQSAGSIGDFSYDEKEKRSDYRVDAEMQELLEAAAVFDTSNDFRKYE